MDKGKLDRPGTVAGHVELRYTGHYAALPPSMHPSGNPYEWRTLPSEEPATVSADLLLAVYDSVTVKEKPKSASTLTPAQATGKGYSDDYVTEEYIRAAFDGELDQLARAAQGGRNDALNAAAHSLGTLVADGLLMESEVISALEVAALAIGLESGEIGATILSGLNAGKAKPRGLMLRPKSYTNGNGAGYAAMFGAQGGQELPDGEGNTPQRRYNPWPYEAQPGKMFFCKQETDKETGETTIYRTPLCDFNAAIVGTVIDEDGGETYQIAGEAWRGGAFSCEISALDFGDNRKLIATLSAAAGPKDPILSGQSNHIGPAIKKLTQGDLIETRRFSRTGWADGRFLIPGREPEGVTLSLHRKLPFAIPGAGDLAKGLAGLEGLLQSMGAEMGTVLLSALFSGPMARLAGWQGERYAVFVRGRTGTLKTSNTQAAMSIYGLGFLQDDALTKWGDGATANALMALATQAHDLPFLIDNYKPNTGGGAHAFVGLIHNILEGGEKDRLTRSATLRDTRPIFCWPICTGEDVPDGDAASLARVLVIPFSEDNRLPKRKEALSIAQQAGAAGHLATVGGAWLDWLESEEGKAAAKRRGAQLVDRRNLWADGLEKVNPRMANPLRVATNLATNDLAWKTLAEHPLLGALAGRYADAHLAGLKTIAAAMAEQTTESSEGERFIYALRELLSTEQAVLMDADESADSGNPFLDPRETSRRIGWIAEDGGAYLLPKSARSAVERLAGNLFMSDQALYDQLDSLGYIGRKDKDRRTLTKRIGGKVQKVLHIQAGALAGDGAA
ncbi:MAG: bifunctional DNA primase/polymerase [Caldilineaceae bacterium]|nr:bifunctional DNA primase/polymerase [Caldilineaceae bacterium]